jgi:hypothetical protein
MGRDREYESNAERQRAYRERLKQKGGAGLGDAERILLMEEIRRLRREVEALRRDITEPYRFNPRTRRYEPVRRSSRTQQDIP